MTINPPQNVIAESRKPLGRVTAIDGSQATITIEAGVSTTGDVAQVTVGRFLGIINNGSVVIGLVTEVSEQQMFAQRGIVTVALTQSILRVETAAIAAAAVVIVLSNRPPDSTI